MKHLLSFFLCMASLFAYPQNGGQHPENSNIRLEYTGKSGSNYFIKIFNKKSCSITVKVVYKQILTDIAIPANSFYSFNMGTGIADLKAKTVQINCGSPDNGWVEWKCSTLPLSFKRVWFERNAYDKNQGVLCFQVADVQNVKQINVRAWLDINTKIEVSVFWPNPLNPNTTYQYVIPDIKALVTRVQNHK